MGAAHGTTSSTRSVVAAAVVLLLAVATVLVLPASQTPASASAPAPQIWIDKAGIVLGPAVPGGTTAAQVVSLKNTGGATASGLTIGSPSNSAFKTSTTCGSTLAVRATCTISVRFAPTGGAATVTGFLNVAWSGGLKTVHLTGQALPATFPFLVGARYLDFGQIPAGATSPGQAVSVTNTTLASVPVSFTGGSAAAPFSVTNDCVGATLAPGASCTFTFRFRPTAVVESTSTSTINLTGGGATVGIAVTLHGSGLGPVQISPTALDFGEVPLGTTSPIQPVVVTNISGVPETLTTTVGAAAGFTIVDHCNGVSLQPGGTCTITFAFKPTNAVSSTVTPAVLVQVNGTTSSTSRTITLTGRGLVGSRTEAFLVTPRGFDFGNAGVGSRAAPQVVTIKNVTTSTVAPDMAGGAATYFGGTQNCQGVPLAPGATCQLTYQFAPAQPGLQPDTTNLRLGSGTTLPDQLISFGFQGVGTEPFLLSPRAFDFGHVAVGVTAPPQVVTLTNVTTATVTPSGAGGAATYYGGNQNCQHVPLAPNASCQLIYRFSPTTTGPQPDSTNGLWAVTTQTGSYGQHYSLSFTGVGDAPAPALVATPNEIDFGDVSAGRTSPAQPIVVTNTGNVPVTNIAFGAPPDPRVTITDGCTSLQPAASCTFNAVFTANTNALGDSTVPLNSSAGSLPVRFVARVRAAPAPANDSFTTFVDTTHAVTNPANGLLANDTGIGLVVAGANPPAHGTVTTNLDGTFTYVPHAGYHGPDSFAYQALDTVGGTRNGTVMITVAYSPNQAFTQAAYRDFLDRPPSDADLRSVAGGLDAGALTRPTVVGLLSSSTEYVSALVNSFYVNTLDRTGEPSGVAYWVDEIRSGRRTVAQVAASFYASDEYFSGIGGGTNRSWVTDLYHKLLGRAPDTAGLDYWVAQVQATGRTSVAKRFYQSSESCHARVKALYQALLGRNPDQGGWDFWAARIATSGDLSLAANLAVSDEYFSRAHARFP